MLVEEVAALFLHWIDESDSTFVTPANVATYLKLGYDELRRRWARIDPTPWQTTVDLSFANAAEYDLALAANPVRLLGNPAGGLTGPRLLRIVEVTIKWTGGWSSSSMSWVGVQNSAQLVPYSNTYFFAGTKLMLAQAITATVTVRYIGDQQVDWTKQAVGDNEWIDDMVEFHDVIALLAAQRYAVRDNAFNPQLQAMLANRLEELDSFAYIGRDLSASTHVQNTYDP